MEIRYGEERIFCLEKNATFLTLCKLYKGDGLLIPLKYQLTP